MADLTGDAPDSAGTPDDASARPLLRVLKGDPTPEQLAALVAVVAARATAAPEAEPVPASRWASRAPLLRRPLPTGPGAWRASGLPGL